MKLFELFGVISVENEEANEKIGDTGKKASGLSDTFKKAGKGIATAGKVMGSGIAIATGAASAAAVQVSETADRIDKMSQNVGFSAEAFQEWDFILTQTGGDIEAAAGGMAMLNEKAVDAMNGGEGNAEAFAKLGLSMEELQGLSREEIFEETIKGLQNMDDEAQRAALASELLGGAGEEMGALLNLTAGEVDNLKNQAHDMGLIMSGETVEAGVAMADQMDIMKRSVMGVLAEAITPLIPVIMELMQSFIAILPPIIEFIKPLIERLVPVISELIEKLLPVFTRLLDALMPVLMPLIDLFLGLLDALMPVIDALLPLIEVILPPLTTLLEGLAPLITGLAELLGGTLSLAIAALTEYWEFLFDALEPVFNMLKDIGEIAGDVAGKVGEVAGGIGEKVSGAREAVGGFFSNFQLPSFDVGTSYVPRDMVAQIHEGERILTAEENEMFSSGRMGGISVTFTGNEIINDQAMEDLADKFVNYVRGNGVLA